MAANIFNVCSYVVKNMGLNLYGSRHDEILTSAKAQNSISMWFWNGFERNLIMKCLRFCFVRWSAGALDARRFGSYTRRNRGEISVSGRVSRNGGGARAGAYVTTREYCLM